MTSDQKFQGGTVADAIRAVIAKIPPSELGTAKPGRVLPYLEAGGIEITPSVRTYTSKLLIEAKSAQNKVKGEIITFDPTAIQTTERRELAMRLIEACGGDFDLVRAEITRLEQFAKKIKGA